MPREPAWNALLQRWVRTVSASDVYTADTTWDEPDLVLSRVPWRDDAPPSAAERRWPGRSIQSSVLDDMGHLLITHDSTSDAPTSEPHGDWAHLEVLDAQTLLTLGTLDIDVWGSVLKVTEGRALVQIPGAVLIVDIRDPSHPTARAAFPFAYNETMIVANTKLHILNNGPTRSYLLDLQNLIE